LKDKIYNSNPWTEELKENVCREIATEQLQRVNQNAFGWCKECLCVEG
jgi:RNA polymerase-binding transcription factor DksA